MNNYFYVLRYYEEENSKPAWHTQRGVVAGSSLADAMRNLEKFYPEIEHVHLYCLETSNCGCLEMELLEETKDGLPEF